MTDLTWTAVRVDTIDRFQGQTPRPEDEAPIIDLFELHPQLVLRAIDETAKALADGKVTWAWSVLRSRLERGTNALREATADTKGSKLKAIERARTWIDNAGIHYDLERHVRAELFGDDYGSGILSDVELTADHKSDLVDYWREQRPRSVEAERLHLEWAEKCKQDKQAIDQWKRKRAAELAAKTPTTADADDIPRFTPTGAKADNTQRGAPPQSQTSGAAR